ncbi:MAG: aspartate/glutamate racemase family protein [Melioribacteraceae bacterium]
MQNIQHIFEKKQIRIIVTDSGLGGLSVQALIDKKIRFNGDKEIDLIYFNSFAGGNFGYNSLKNKDNKLKVFNSALTGMIKFNPDIILIACNTLSVLYHETEISKIIKIPVIGIVDSGIEMVLNKIDTESEFNIIILGTDTTIKSNQYKLKLVENGISEKTIINQICENLESEIQINPSSEKVENLIRKYLNESYQKILNPQNRQFILLACTHYGYSTKIFEKVLADLFGNNFTILNPNEKMAEIFDGMKKTNGIKQNIVKNRILSRVKIRQEQTININELLKSDSIYIVEAIKNAEYIPDLFSFDENSINQK